MRTYTVTRKKSSKLGEVFYSIGNFSFRFKKGSTTFKSVPEVIAVRIVSDYRDGFSVKLDPETAEPKFPAEVGELTAGHLDDLIFKEEN